MAWNVWLAYLAAAWLIALSPGSGAVLCITQGSQHGVRRTSATIAGLQAGVLALLLVAGLGVGSLLLASETAFAIVKLLGACYLIWLGVQQWRSRHGMFDNASEALSAASAGSWRKRFMTGFLTNVTNPKGIVFTVAVLPQFIDPRRPLALQLLILAVTTVATDVIVMHGYAFFGRMLRRVFKSPQAARWQNRAFGGFFVALGVMLLFVQRRQTV